MSRNLDTSLQAALTNSNITLAVLAALTFKSGVMYAWSGVGDLVYNGNTYKGVGMLGSVSAINEGTDVQADGMTVTLSGIQLAALANNPPPSGLVPPVTVPAGTYVAWSLPGAVTESVGGSGSVAATLSGALITFDVPSPPSGDGTISATWSDFQVPSLPADAVITGMYATAMMTASAGPAFPSGFGAPNYPGATPYSGQYSFNTGLSTTAELEAFSTGAQLAYSLFTPFNQTLTVGNPSVAVYYTSASNAVPALNEALGDIQLGAAAQIYFGLLSGGTIIGAPYLLFSGQIDQPTVNIGTDTISITLALENKLTNLARPTARRYTAADQHILYPDDIGFNWVETLNDIALRWGS